MSSIRKNFFYNALYQILNICVPLITTPYLSRILGAEGIGTYSYFHSIAHYFVLFIMLGLNNYGSRTIAQARSSKTNCSNVFCGIYAMQLFMGIIINVLYFIYCFLLEENRNYALAMTMYVLSGCLDITWFFNGLEKFKLTAMRSLMIKIATAIAIFAFVKDTYDTLVYCLIMTGGILISQCMLWPYAMREIRFIKPSVQDVLVHVKPNCTLFLTVLAVSIYKIMDKIMLGIISNVAQVGYYELSEKIITVPMALVTSLGTIMLPRTASLMTNKEYKKEDGDMLLGDSMLFVMFLSSSMCFGIMGVSREFVTLFYGPNYDICVALYLILLPSCIFLGFGNVIRTQYLIPRHVDRPYVVSGFLGAIINFTLNISFIPSLGAIGAAVATFMAELVVCIYQCILVRKSIPVGSFFRRSLPFVLAGIVMFAILISLHFNLTNWSALLIKIVLGIALYFILLVVFALLFKVDIKTTVQRWRNA